MEAQPALHSTSGFSPASAQRLFAHATNLLCHDAKLAEVPGLVIQLHHEACWGRGTCLGSCCFCAGQAARHGCSGAQV